MTCASQRPCATGTGWAPLRLPPHDKRRGGCSPVPLLSQTAVRAPRQQPLPSPTRCSTSTGQSPRGRLPSCRCSNSESRRFARRRLTRWLQVLDSFSQTSFGLESSLSGQRYWFGHVQPAMRSPTNVLVLALTERALPRCLPVRLRGPSDGSSRG